MITKSEAEGKQLFYFFCSLRLCEFARDLPSSRSSRVFFERGDELD
jgi:hypothetical protein